jgi:uncharacterized OB-fold protein
MKSTTAALALLVTMLVTLPVLPPGGGPASAVPAPSGGRNGPPANGTEWNIVENFTVDHDMTFTGNITVFTGISLYIHNGARLTVPHRAGSHWVFFVKAGGYVEVKDSSLLDIDWYQAESGTYTTVQNNSAVRANGVFNATGGATVLDSSINVTAASGTNPSDAGESAILFLGTGGLGGSIQHSTLSVTAGDGLNGYDTQGTDGGPGGDVSIMMSSNDFINVTLNARAGHGGKGGTAGTTTVNGGRGGKGGNLFMKMGGNSIVNSAITASSGVGGDGTSGFGGTGFDAGSAGDGGDGGAVDFRWAGGKTDGLTGMAITSSILNVSAGHGGSGGDGGRALSQGKAGGNGARGGRGGSILVNITCNGPMALTDSTIGFQAGYAPSGGICGLAVPGGRDGQAGDGGDGGSSACTMALNDSFKATNATVFSIAGSGGTGGLGTSAGNGGTGGTGILNISVQTLLTEDTMVLKNGAFTGRGGNGGNGGKAISSGNAQGQPGNGGKGGRANLYLYAEKSVDVSASKLLCDEGLSGAADKPAKPGNPGVGELMIYSGVVNLVNTAYSQTMGPVDDNDLWTLDSSPITRVNPPLKPPHILPPTEFGVAEEYWSLTCLVQDIFGKPVTTGTSLVEVYRGDSLVTSKRADASGKAVFRLLGSRYTASDQTVGIVYSAKAADDSGMFSYSVGAQMVQDQIVTLTLISKGFAPLCAITAPDERLTPQMDASQYIRQGGLIDQYLIEGNAQDSPQNNLPSISQVEVKIGDGQWVSANFQMASPGFYKWNLTWDLYNWSVAELATYPLGIIPCPIYARAFNDKLWSDDLDHSGKLTVANITVRLLKIPPRPPVIQIVKPKPSPLNGTTSTIEVSSEKEIAFDGIILNSSGTKVTRWEWYFNDTSSRADYSSPVSPSTNVSYPRYDEGNYFYVTLKVYDNESQTRVDLLAKGVGYDEFGYPFELDGGVLVRLRVYVKESPHIEDSAWVKFIKGYGAFIVLGIIMLVAMAAAAYTFQVRRRHIAERKAKDERETLRIDVSEMTCARCSEPIADPSKGCSQCKAQDALGQVQQRLLDMKGSGVNISDAEAMLEEGVDAFDAKAYEEAYEKAQKAKEKAAELEAKYQETAAVINGWETRIAALKVDRPGADVTEAETKVYHSRLALGRGDHAEALRNLEGLESVLAKADKVGMRRGAEELLESTRRMVANIQKRGVMIEAKIEKALGDAGTALEKADYDTVTARCKEAEALVKETNRGFMRAIENLRQSESRVLNAKGMSQSLGATEEWLAQAKTAMAGGNYAAVIEATNRVLGFFGISPRAPAAAEKKVDWKREVAILEGREGKEAAAPARPKPAAPQPAAGVLEVEPSPEMKDATEKLIRETHDTIARAREQAVDVTDGEDLLEKAKDAYKARRYEEAQDLAKSAMFLMTELAATAPKARGPAAARPAAGPAIVGKPAALSGAAAELKATIEKAEGLAGELSRFGGDVTGPESKLTRAKAARDGGSPGVAMQYAKESIEESEGLMKEYLDAKKSMDEVMKALEAAKTKGLDVADAEFQLKQARAAMAGGAFVRASDTAMLVTQMLAELEPSAAPAPAAPAPKRAAPAEEAAPKVPSVKCPSCGRDAKPHWKTCPFCGATISGEKPAAPAPEPVKPAVAVKIVAPDEPRPPVVVRAPAQPAPKPAAPSAEAPPQAAKCPKCGAALKPHWKVCPACGSEIAPAAGAPPSAPKEARCPACGAKVEPGWTSCPACKTALVPASGAKPEAPKKVLKVAKKLVVVTKEEKK